MPKIAKRLGQSLRQKWVHELFLLYTDLLLEKVYGTRSIPAYLRRDLGLFAHLDRHFSSASELTNTALVRAIGPRELRRYHRACGFLVTRGLIQPLSEPEVEWVLTELRAQELRDQLEFEWARTAYSQFHEALMKRRTQLISHGHRRTREPMTPKGVLSALYGAAHLLRSAELRGGHAIQDITQRDVDALFSKTKLAPHRVARFITYLNTQTPRFHRLKLPRRGTRRGLPEGILGADDYDKLMRQLLQREARADLPFTLVALLCLVFAQAPHRALRIQLDQVRQKGGVWEIQFVSEWVTMPAEMSTLLAKWLPSRRELSVVEDTGTSQYLFPGRRAGSSLTTDALHSWLRQFGVKPQQLQSSSIAQMVQTEEFHPSFAMSTLGLTRTCIAKYLGALASPEMKRVPGMVLKT